MKKQLRGYLITGLLVVVPLYISIYVLAVIVRFMDSLIVYLPPSLRPDTYLGVHIHGVGIVITLIGITIVGFLATNFMGKKLVRFGERMLAKIPILRGVYKGTKQFMETFFAKDGTDGFSRVVLLEYPRKGLYAIGFVTGKTREELQVKTPNEGTNVFLPTTPNPTSGFYIVVPTKDVVPLSMNVEDAFKVIMTGGMVVPEYMPSEDRGFMAESGAAPEEKLSEEKPVVNPVDDKPVL